MYNTCTEGAWGFSLWVGCLLPFTGRALVPGGWAPIVGAGAVIITLGRVLTRKRREPVAMHWYLSLSLAAGSWFAPLILHLALAPTASDSYAACVKVALYSLTAFAAAVATLGLNSAERATLAPAAMLAGLGALLIVTTHADVYVSNTWQDTGRYREHELASTVSLGLLFSLLAAVGISSARGNLVLGGVVLLAALGGGVVVSQRAVPIIAVALVFLAGRWGTRAIFAGVFTLVTLVGFLPAIPESGPLELFARSTAVLATPDAVTAREGLAWLGVASAMDHPFLGGGPGQWQVGLEPHVFPLQAWSDLGVFGAVVALWMALPVFCHAFRMFRSPEVFLSTDRTVLLVSAACWLFAMKAADLTYMLPLLPLSVATWRIGSERSSNPPSR